MKQGLAIRDKERGWSNPAIPLTILLLDLWMERLCGLEGLSDGGGLEGGGREGRGWYGPTSCACQTDKAGPDTHYCLAHGQLVHTETEDRQLVKEKARGDI